MLMNKQVYNLTALLILNTFVITCQDIAVDSWAVEMLHEENASYASMSQAVGHKLGSLVSTTMFVALNSVDFCNSYIFSERREEPLLTIPSFI